MTLEDLYAAILSVKEATEFSSVRSDARFGSLETRFDSLEARFDSLENRFERRFDRLETRIESLEDGQKAMRSELAAINRRMR